MSDAIPQKKVGIGFRGVEILKAFKELRADDLRREFEGRWLKS
jgi:hypothetical protein